MRRTLPSRCDLAPLHPRARLTLLLSCALLAATACDQTFVTTPMVVALGANNEPHLAVERLQSHTYFVEGTISVYDTAFVSRTTREGDWTHANLSYGSTQAVDGRFGLSARSLVIGADGRDYLALQSQGAITIRSRLAGPWASIAIAPGLDQSVFGVSLSNRAINTAWTGADGVVRFVLGSSLLEVGNNTAVRAIPIQHDCSLYLSNTRNVVVSPTGDRAADVAVFVPLGGGLTHSHPGTFSCTATECTWQDRTGDDFVSTTTLSLARECSLFRLADGTTTLACTYEPLVANPFFVVVSAPGRALFQVQDARLIGAMPMRAGGFALAVGSIPTSSGIGPISVIVVDAAGASRRFDIEPQERDDVLTFATPSGLAAEAIDIFVGRHNDVTRLRVDLATGATQRDDVPLGE